MAMKEHNRPLLVVLNIGALLVFILTAILNGLASQPNLGVFISSTGVVSDKYYVEITPAGWTFSIWGLIYLWQALWIVYSLTLMFRKGSQGPLYYNPILLSPAFFFIYIVNLFLNIGWLFLFDRELLELAFVFLFLIAITLYMCLWLSYRALEQNRAVLAVENRKVDNILIRVFVHNGLGIYAAWTSIATFLNMGFVVAYRSNPAISQNTASSIALAFIAVILVMFIITDLTVFDKYTRFTITPYAVTIWALCGSMAKNFKVLEINSAFSVVLLGLAFGALIVKIAIIVCLGSKPIFSSSVDIVYQEKESNIEAQEEASNISTQGSASDAFSQTSGPENVTQESILDSFTPDGASDVTEEKTYHITNHAKTPDNCTPESVSENKA